MVKNDTAIKNRPPIIWGAVYLYGTVKTI